MTNDPFSFWTGDHADASFSEAGVCQKRATSFEKAIRRRNLVEYTAAALVIAVFGLTGLFFAKTGEWTMLAAVALTIAGAIFVTAKLHRDGSVQERLPEIACKDHLKAQLIRQRDLLRSVPTWYLLPFVPGILGFYLAVTARMAEHQGWPAALEGVSFKLAATVAFFVLVWWLNHRTARRLDREIEAINRA